MQIRTDAAGNILSNTTYGFGTLRDRARHVVKTADGGYLVTGDRLISGASDGSTQWAKVFGGSSNERFHALAIRPSSFGYTAVGYSETFTNGGRDFYFVATDINGNTNCHQSNWTPTNATVSPTVTTSGIAVNTVGHSSFTQSFLTTNPNMPTTCRCIEERPRIDITGPVQVCRNQTGVVYSIPGVTGVTNYSWTATNATITSPLNSTSVTVDFGTSNAQLIVQASYGNCSNFNIDTINIPIDPITATITGTSPICLNQSSLLTANAVNPQSGVSGYSWSNSVTTQTNSVKPPIGANTYTVTITDGLGCTATSSFIVNVNPLPTPGIISNSPVCIDQTITLQGTGGTSYSWIGPNAFSSSIQNPTIPNAQNVNAGVYTVTVTDANNCVASDNIIVSYQPLPTVDLGADQILCQGESVQIGFSYPGATYIWNTGASTSFINVTIPGTYTLTVSVCNTNVSDNVTIIAGSLDVILLNIVTPDCGQSNGSITVDAVNGIGTIDYSWPAEPSQTTAQLTNVSSGSYTVIATDQAGCTDVLTTSLSCNSLDLNIPQFISPNGDSKNDIWIIDNLPTDFPNNQLKIFNRWGNEVYVASPYQNNWDGRPNTVLSLGNNVLPAGTYFYVLDLFYIVTEQMFVPDLLNPNKSLEIQMLNYKEIMKMA